MNPIFIDELIDSLSNMNLEIRTGDQQWAKGMMEETIDDFPMTCFEFTKDSEYEVPFEESKFLNDPIHNGFWIMGMDDDNIHFLVNLKSEKNTLIIDVFEVNNYLQGNGVGSNVIDTLEYVAEDFYEEIKVSPYDTNALNFWEHLGYKESHFGYWKKELDEYE